jgi:hypothetical protein
MKTITPNESQLTDFLNRTQIIRALELSSPARAILISLITTIPPGASIVCGTRGIIRMVKRIIDKTYSGGRIKKGLAELDSSQLISVKKDYNGHICRITLLFGIHNSKEHSLR